jgi:hypothetical protein
MKNRETINDVEIEMFMGKNWLEVGMKGNKLPFFCAESSFVPKTFIFEGLNKNE